MRSVYFDAKLRNWGDWMRRRELGALGYGQSPLANLMGRAQRAEAGCIVPVDEVDASLIDDAVRSTRPELQRVAKAWYVDDCSVREVARRCGCGTATVSVRVEQLQREVAIWWSERKERRSISD